VTAALHQVSAIYSRRVHAYANVTSSGFGLGDVAQLQNIGRARRSDHYRPHVSGRIRVREMQQK
jgi:hypothetical protein